MYIANYFFYTCLTAQTSAFVALGYVRIYEEINISDWQDFDSPTAFFCHFSGEKRTSTALYGSYVWRFQSISRSNIHGGRKSKFPVSLLFCIYIPA